MHQAKGVEAGLASARWGTGFLRNVLGRLPDGRSRRPIQCQQPSTTYGRKSCRRRHYGSKSGTKQARAASNTAHLRKAPGNVGVDVRTKRVRCRRSQRRCPHSGVQIRVYCDRTSGMRQYSVGPQAWTRPSSSSFSEQPRGAPLETGPALPRPIPIRTTSGLSNNGTPP